MPTARTLQQEVVGRLRSLPTYCDVVTGPPSGQDWVRLADLLADDTLMDSWFDLVLKVRADGVRHVAGAFLARDLVGSVMATVGVALVEQRRGDPA